MPLSTLWHTLEQQRIQSEEDDKWLEEEEEKLVIFEELFLRISILWGMGCRISKFKETIP